jgi:hypothetical protein
MLRYATLLCREGMAQTNAKSGFQRKVQRTELPRGPQPLAAGATAGASSGKVTLKAGDLKKNAKLKAAGKAAMVASATSTTRDSNRRVARGASSKSAGSLVKPAELAGEDALLLREGQLLQVSKQRPDGWAFGSVVSIGS